MIRHYPRRGAAGQQYAIIVGLISVIAILAVTQMGSGVKSLMTNTGNTLTNVVNGSVGSGGSGGSSPPPPPPPAVTTLTCKTILDTGGSTGNGTYTIDPDGPGGAAAFSAYCDMTGGGWTRPSASGFFTLNHTGGIQQITTPATSTTFSFIALGGAGGNFSPGDTEAINNGSRPGYGGQTSGTYIASASSTLYVHVGGRGTNALPEDSGTCNVNFGGYNGGGTGTRGGSGGGGATDVRTVGGAWNDSASLNSRILVAAGGGGCGFNGCEQPGGHGGGLTGSDGTGGTSRGYGGTPTSPGSTSSGNSSANGGFGFGGNSVQCNDEGGGGGGWYGGGAGGNSNSPAGGGSSYHGGVTGGATTAGVNSNLDGTTGGNGRLQYIFQ